jgi:hypothetical protein
MPTLPAQQQPSRHGRPPKVEPPATGDKPLDDAVGSYQALYERWSAASAEAHRLTRALDAAQRKDDSTFAEQVRAGREPPVERKQTEKTLGALTRAVDEREGYALACRREFDGLLRLLGERARSIEASATRRKREAATTALEALDQLAAALEPLRASRSVLAWLAWTRQPVDVERTFTSRGAGELDVTPPAPGQSMITLDGRRVPGTAQAAAILEAIRAALREAAEPAESAEPAEAADTGGGGRRLVTRADELAKLQKAG